MVMHIALRRRAALCAIASVAVVFDAGCGVKGPLVPAPRPAASAPAAPAQESSATTSPAATPPASETPAAPPKP